MKKSITALALALTLVGSLAACSNDKNPGNNNGSTTGSGTNGSAASAGQVGRRYGGQSAYDSRSYLDDGRYTAGSNGQVYGSDGNTLSRDLTQGARDIVRGAGDAIGDIGRGIGDAARDVTGNGAYSGTPSWEPDSSARY